MNSLQDCLPELVAILRQQPLSDAKLAFCWRLAAGPAMARATTVLVGRPGEVVVRTPDMHWTREVTRALPELRARLSTTLGLEAVARMNVQGPTGRR